MAKHTDPWDQWHHHEEPITSIKTSNSMFGVKTVTSSNTDVSSKDPWSKNSFARCTHHHPPLPLPGTDKVIYGGACGSPAFSDGDVYIGFDEYSMRHTPRNWPWKKGHEFVFKIRDMGAPDNPEEFAKLVAWTRGQLAEGKKVHCGCIGGHGRTGTFLAALVSTYGEPDAISYVRQHYCEKAVESAEQVTFLHKHFGIKVVEGSKAHSRDSFGTGRGIGKHRAARIIDADFTRTREQPIRKGSKTLKITPLKYCGSMFERQL